VPLERSRLTESVAPLYPWRSVTRASGAPRRAVSSVTGVILEESIDPAFVTARPLAPADALARLAAGAAHELNNPLSVMVGYLSLIDNGRTPPGQLSDQLRRVAEEAQQCRLVLRGLTELAECTLADAELLDIRVILAEAQAALGERAPLAVSVHGDASAPLMGQARGLACLVSHGLRNAVEASARSLIMKLTRLDGATRLELRDDGAGMSALVLARAREPFYSNKAGHLGLGLAICDAVAWAHRGTLQLSSREGSGTSLTLTVPDAPSGGGS
jgi:two-component system, NtrC family, sensor kinase